MIKRGGGLLITSGLDTLLYTAVDKALPNCCRSSAAHQSKKLYYIRCKAKESLVRVATRLGKTLLTHRYPSTSSLLRGQRFSVR